MSDPIATPADVAELRAVAEAGLLGGCTVARNVSSAAAGGSRVAAWVMVVGLTDLPCGFRAEPPAEGVAADAPRTVTRYRVRLGGAAVRPGAPVILPNDRLTITHTVPGVPSPLVLSVIGPVASSYGDVTRLVLAETVGTVRSAG